MAEIGLLPIDQEVETMEVMPLIFPPASKPFYNQQPLFVEALEDYLHFGSFVKLHVPAVNDDGTPTEREYVVRLIRRNSTGHIIVEQYKPLPLQHHSPAVLGNSMNLVAEYYKSSTGWMIRHPEKFITSICFVFSTDVFEEMSNEWALGKTNLYFVKKKSILVQDKDVGDLVDLEEQLCPFPCRATDTKYISCLPLRIWTGLEQIHRMIAYLLNRVAESQGEICSSSEKQFFGCLAAPNYVTQMVRLLSDLEPKILNTTSSIAHTDPCGLTQKKTKYSSTGVFLRFETKEHLELLRSILGHTVTSGLRKRSPRLQQSNDLILNDAINIVVGSKEVESPYRRRTTRRGVDIFFTSVYLKVTLRYEKYLYRRSHNGDILNCPDDHVSQMIKCYRHLDNDDNTENQAPIDCCVGDYFMYKNEFCKVEVVTAEYVQVSVVTPIDRKGMKHNLYFNDAEFSKFIADRN
jgi:hypothetical protein